MLGTAVVVSALVAAGCGGGVVDGADPIATTVEPSTTSVPIPPTTALTEEQAVLAAYQGYWDTWLAANDPPNPDHPDLERYATGAALAKVRDSITKNRSVGQVIRKRDGALYRHEAQVKALEADRAVVLDCSIDDAVVVDYGSGRVLNDEVVRRLLRAELVAEGGLWRVADVAAVGATEEPTKCAG